jgi:hypothetical protein
LAALGNQIEQRLTIQPLELLQLHRASESKRNFNNREVENDEAGMTKKNSKMTKRFRVVAVSVQFRHSFVIGHSSFR